MVRFPTSTISSSICFLFGHGAGNYVSRQLGAKHTEEAQKMAATGFVLSFLTGLLIAILGHLFLTPLCLLMGSTPTILPYTERYLGAILLGLIVLVLIIEWISSRIRVKLARG